MFNFISRANFRQSPPDNTHETYAQLDSDGVSYHIYTAVSDVSVEINTYIVHPVRGGIIRHDRQILIRRDRQILGAPLFNWGGHSKLYAGAN